MGEKYLKTEIFDMAAKFAIDCHKNTERRGKGFPYIIHPMEAAEIVATMTNDQELLAAAILHDVVEDTEATKEEITFLFGERVANIVDHETDPEFPELSKSESWIKRKEIAIERLKNSSYDVKIVAMGDKLSNIRAIYRDYLNLGDKVWDKFHVTDPKLHEWHYRGLLDALKQLDGTEPYLEFEHILDEIWGKK